LLDQEPGQPPREIDPSLGASAESAIHPGVASIPRITFVILDAVFSQEFALFVLKGAAAMVFLLGLHVSEEHVELARAHRRRDVAAPRRSGTSCR
jgi:hypothetical protein